MRIGSIIYQNFNDYLTCLFCSAHTSPWLAPQKHIVTRHRNLVPIYCACHIMTLLRLTFSIAVLVDRIFSLYAWISYDLCEAWKHSIFNTIKYLLLTATPPSTGIIIRLFANWVQIPIIETFRMFNTGHRRGLHFSSQIVLGYLSDIWHGRYETRHYWERQVGIGLWCKFKHLIFTLALHSIFRQAQIFFRFVTSLIFTHYS